MIHLDLNGTAGGAVYVDVQGIETRQGRGETLFVLGGTLGDGVHEGQVVVEVGRAIEVFLVDEWLAGGNLSPLLDQLGRQTVQEAIRSAASELLFCLETGDAGQGGAPRVTGYGWNDRWYAVRPREYGEQLELPLLVADAATAWECRAA